MKKIILLHSAVAVPVLFLFWLLAYRNTLWWMEGMSFFSTLPDFAVLQARLPSGLLEYVASYLLQFYHLAVAGALLQTLYGWIVMVCADVVVWRVVRRASLSWISFIPVGIFVSLQCRYNDGVGSMVWALAAVAAAMVAVCVTRRPEHYDTGLDRRSLLRIVVVPLVMIILVGLLRAYGLPLKLENFTFDNYINLFKSKMVKDSVVNSLTLSVSAGLIAMFLGVMIAYVIQKIRPKGKTVLEIISILPYSIPGIVLAIGVILSWSGAFGINLYNTLWIILIAYIARYLAFSMKSASASLQQVHDSLEDAARTCGATHFESLTDVTLPLIRPAMISGFFLIFLPAMRELTTSVLLYGPYTRTLGVAIYSLRSDGYIVDSSALASLAIVLIIICNTVVNAILKDRKKV